MVEMISRGHHDELRECLRPKMGGSGWRRHLLGIERMGGGGGNGEVCNGDEKMVVHEIGL